jgi:tetratricopeptide (TPR) repeat protein
VSAAIDPTSSFGPVAILVLALLALAAVLAIASPLAFNFTWRDERDEVMWAVATGFIVALSLILPVILIVWSPWPTYVRFALCLAVLLVGLFMASRQWLRRSIRVAGSIGILLVCALVVDIGRDADQDAANEVQPATAASQQVAAMATTHARAVARNRTDLLEQRERLDRERRVSLVSRVATMARAVERTDRDEGRAALALARAIQSPTPDVLRDKRRLYEDSFHAATASPKESQLHRLVTTALNARTAIHNIDQRQAALERAAQHVADMLGDSDNTTQATLDVAVARLELRELIYRRTLGHRHADGAVDAARDELSAAVTVPATADKETLPLPDALAGGGDAIVRDLTGSSEHLPLELDLASWLFLAVLGLFAWQIIERRSGQRLKGPVSVDFSPLPAESIADKTDYEAPFRVALFENVREPGLAPGGTSTAPVTDFAELASILPATWLKPLIQMLQRLLSAPYGYRAVVDVVPPPLQPSPPRDAGSPSALPLAGAARSRAEPAPAAPTKGAWSILVRITDVANGQQIEVFEEAGSSIQEAARIAGYRAAATVLGRSRRTPTWARWPGDTARALAAYSSGGDRGTVDLERAVALAPNSGILLHLLADNYELEDRHAEAMALYARVVSQYPRHVASHYRLAASLQIISNKIEERWYAHPLNRRIFFGEALEHAVSRLNNRPADPAQARKHASTTETEFRDLSRQLHLRLNRATNMWNLTLRLLRQSERDLWIPAILNPIDPFGLRQRAHWIPKSGTLLVDDDTGDVEKAEKKAKDPRSWWQLSYNLACYYASRKDDTEMSLFWLNSALTRNGFENLSVEWLKMDPDLRSLRGHPGFEAIVAARSTEKTGGT